MNSQSEINDQWNNEQENLGLNDKEHFPSLPLDTGLSIPTTNASALMLSDDIPNLNAESQRDLAIESDSSSEDEKMSESDSGSETQKPSSLLFACANPNQPPPVVHEISSEEEEESDDDEEQEEDDSSSEDEDADHSEHFFKLAKEQVGCDRIF